MFQLHSSGNVRKFSLSNKGHFHILTDVKCSSCIQVEMYDAVSFDPNMNTNRNMQLQSKQTNLLTDQHILRTRPHRKRESWRKKQPWPFCQAQLNISGVEVEQSLERRRNKMPLRYLDTISKMFPSLFWGVLENRICQIHFQKHPLHVSKRRAREGAASEVGKNVPF